LVHWILSKDQGKKRGTEYGLGTASAKTAQMGITKDRKKRVVRDPHPDQNSPQQKRSGDKIMSPDFRCVALPYEPFSAFFAMSDEELENHGGRRMAVDQNPGTPCRVSLCDATVGEQVILVPFKHHDVDSPFQASGPLFVRQDAPEARYAINEIPPMLHQRLLSVRSYDARGMMIDADVIAGNEVDPAIRRLFANPESAYLHLHNAGLGCFLCAVERI
jgi:hypothetical protein